MHWSEKFMIQRLTTSKEVDGKLIDNLKPIIQKGCGGCRGKKDRLTEKLKIRREETLKEKEQHKKPAKLG